MDIKGFKNNVGLMFIIYFYTNTNKPTGMASVGVTGSGSCNFGFKATTEWQTLSKCIYEYTDGSKIRVPDGAKYARIFLYRAASSGAGDIYIDNVELRPICPMGTHTFNEKKASTVAHTVTDCQSIYYIRCDKCDFFRDLGAIGVKNGTIAGPSTHDLTYVPAKPATPEETGTTEYWVCKNCQLWYGDARGRTEIKDHDSIIVSKKYSNLLEKYNPSFEGEVDGDDPVSWTPYAAGNDHYSVTTEEATAGTHSLKFALDENAPRACGIQSQVVNIGGMKKLSYMFDVKGDVEVMAWMYFYDASMNAVSVVEGEPNWFNAAPMANWTSFSKQYTVPEGAWYAKIMFYRTPTKPGTVYIDNVVLKEYEESDEIKMPTSFFDSFEDGCNKKSLLPWGWDHVNNSTKPTDEHTWIELVKADGSDPSVPKATDGEYVLKFEQIETDQTHRVIWGPYIDVSDMEAVRATIDLWSESYVQLQIYFYDAQYNTQENDEWKPYQKEEFENEWGQINLEVAVPEGAVYARLRIAKLYTVGYGGVSYMDRVVLTETDPIPTAPPPPKPNAEVHYDWKIVETDHPRVYFNAEELRRIKKWANSESETSVGFTGKEAYQDLIKDADLYLSETEFSNTVADMRYTVQLTPVLQDMSIYEPFFYPPAADYANPYPYLTRLCQMIEERTQTLALAYVLSGNKAYGERAVQYATDLCKWKYWIHEIYVVPGDTNITEQSTNYCTTSVATTYDLCYDLLTENQKKLMEDALIEKALEPMWITCETRMGMGRDMDHMACTFVACCAILNEDNIGRLSKYLDRAMQYNDWIFDWYDAGHNEGYSYAENGIEQLFEGMAIIERVTGITGNLDHHFATETLPAWIKGFVESNRGTMPGYSDSTYDPFFTITLTTLARRGDQAAGFCVYLAGGAEVRPFDKLIYGNLSDDYIMPPEDNYMNVTVVETMGVGSLRTGWGKLDKLMVMISDDYPCGHAHWEANSIFMALNGKWVIKDVGYGSIQAAVAKTYYDMQYAANTIFVDNKAQTVKGAGTIQEVFNSELYGHIMGSAPSAYGKFDGEPIVDKFDRHTIMLNHDSESYYVVIDDLESRKEHVFGWNLYQAKWNRVELDGKEFDFEKAKAGNHLAILDEGLVLHYEFVGEQLEFSAPLFKKSGETFGPLFRANAKAAKNQQFMTVISVDTEYEGLKAIDSTSLLTARSSNLSHDDPNGWSWYSSNDLGMVIALPMGQQYGLNMLRAGAIGDWMSFPFEVEETGEYIFSLLLGSWKNYAGKWQAYLDGKPIGDLYTAKSTKNAPVTVQMEEEPILLTAGTHQIKMVLVSDPETEDLEWGTLISMGQVILEQERSSLGQGTTEVLESYDNENVLGATVRYGLFLKDVVLFNRGTKTMTAGNLTSDADQATVLGIDEEEITEGFTMVNGTNAKFGDQVLMTADGRMDIAVDYRFAKIPVLNMEMTEQELLIYQEELLQKEDHFDITKPRTRVTTSADAQRNISLLVGTDAPHVVTIDGTEVEHSYADGMISLTVPEGDHSIEILGTHYCTFDQKATNIMNIKSWATCTEGAVYYVSCYCGENGTETFVDGEPKGHNIVAVKAKEATETEEGCIAHYACKNCDAVYADAEGKQPLELSAVIIPKLEAKAPEKEAVADNSWIIWVAVAGGVVILAAGVLLLLKFKFGFFKKKE